MATQKTTFMVKGMHCSACQTRVYRALTKTAGVMTAMVDLAGAKAEVEFDPAKVTIAQLKQAVRDVGYEVTEQ